MRLREIQKIIRDNIPNLKGIKPEDYRSGGNVYKKINNYDSIRISLTNLLDTGLFEDEKQIYLKKNLLISVSDNSMTFDTAHCNSLISTTNRIIYKATAIDDLISQNLHSEDEDSNSLIVSLPDRDLNFKEFANLVELLKDTFKLLNVLKEFQQEVAVENFDVGSKWFVLGFASEIAVKLFGKLTTIVQRNQVITRQFEAYDKHLEAIGVEVETRNEIRESQLKTNQAIYEKLSAQFLEENDLDKQAEILSQVTKVTENIDKILSQGIGFESAITAANDIAQTFPSLVEQKKLDQTALIEKLKEIPYSTEDDSK